MNLHNVRAWELKCVALLAAALVLAAAGQASAGPYDAPYIGKPNSFHVAFDWVSIDQDDWDLVEYDPFPLNYEIYDGMDTSATDGGGDVAVIMQNFVDPLPLKLLRVQMFFDGAVEGALIGMDVLPHDPMGATREEVGRSTGIANVHYVDWEVRPNPDWEEILIAANEAVGIFPGNLLRIEVDTISIPEPSSLLLLGIGLAGLIGCVRKRRTR